MKKHSTEKQASSYLVPALAKGLKLLEQLSAHPEGLSMTSLQIPELSGATAFRMLTTLVECGYAVHQADGTYRLNGKLLRIASRAVADQAIVPVADPVMRQLRDQTGESVALAVLHGNEGVVLHQVVSNCAVKVVLELGHHFPLHSAAPAKAILAFLPEEEREVLLHTLSFTRFTERTIATVEAFRAELEQVHSGGAAFDRGEELEELRCVAAPIFVNGENRARAAIWISGPASRVSDEKMQKFAPLVIAAAQQISNSLN